MTAAVGFVALSKSKAGASTPITASAAPPKDELAVRNRTAIEPPAENSDFIHPDHVIPPPDYSRFDELIVVCCHAVFLPDAEDADFPLRSPHDENNWLLAPFQKSNPDTGKQGEHSTFLAHAQAGINALTVSPGAYHLEKNLLIFSGAATKQSQTSTSEARSYYHAALSEELSQGYLGGGRTHALFRRGRILLEEHATDSFQNLLLSVLLFRRTTGKYPRSVRVITHAFKSRRFLELHAPAIRWPANRIQVQGIDPVLSAADLSETLDGEEKFGFAPWKKDSLGTSMDEKRKQRGWNESIMAQLLDGVEESVKQFLQGDSTSQLPWEEAISTVRPADV